jgi:hypothetical protein
MSGRDIPVEIELRILMNTGFGDIEAIETLLLHFQRQVSSVSGILPIQSLRYLRMVEKAEGRRHDIEHC